METIQGDIVLAKFLHVVTPPAWVSSRAKSRADQSLNSIALATLAEIANEIWGSSTEQMLFSVFYANSLPQWVAFTNDPYKFKLVVELLARS